MSIVIWNQVGQKLNDKVEEDESVYSVGLSSDETIIAIGAPKNGVTNRGQVRVYGIVGDSWGKIGQDIDGENAGDESGFSVSLSSDGTIVAIGAPFNGSGHVKVYGVTGENWEQIGQTLYGDEVGDNYGRDVNLSSGGTIIAIGAILKNRESIEDAGNVRVYGITGGNWEQISQDIYGENTNYYSGRYISLSSDGTIVSIGACGNDGVDYGHLRVYGVTGGSWNQIGQVQDIDCEAMLEWSGWAAFHTMEQSSLTGNRVTTFLKDVTEFMG